MSEPTIDPLYLQYLDDERDRALSPAPSHKQRRPTGLEVVREAIWGQTVQRSDVRQHSIQTNLPVDKEGRAGVYGVHEGQHIYGPLHYPTFDKLKGQYVETISSDQPLLPQQVRYLKSRGFKFLERIGKGSYGEVWKVLATKLKKVQINNVEMFVDVELACKVLALKKMSTNSTVKEAVNKLMKESDIHSTLNHSNIVQKEEVIYLLDQKSRFPQLIHICLFMELCDGDLESIIYEPPDSRLSECQTHQWFQQIVEGLRYLHQQNVVHMDIKPKNILYKTDTSNNNIYKLTDFGLSLKFSADEPTIAYKRVGTTKYIAPEMPKRGQKTGLYPYETKPTDIYSLGITLAESMSGSAVDHKRLMASARNWTHASYPKYRISESLAHLITSMTQWVPSDRPSIQEVCAHHWVTTQL